jgi:hypothetical protein
VQKKSGVFGIALHAMPRMLPSRKVGDRRSGASGGVVMTSLVTITAELKAHD